MLTLLVDIMGHHTDGHRNHVEGRNKEGWGGVRVKNVLREEVGRWLHLHAQKTQAEKTVDLTESLDT